MKHFLPALLLLTSSAIAQQPQAPLQTLSSKPLLEHIPFGDLHIHTTFKHYYGDILDNQQLQDIYNHRQDLNYLRSHYGRINWESRVRKQKALRAKKASNIKNYNQSDFHNLRATPGSVFCTSLYPYEKQFAISGLKRGISNLFVSGIPFWRLRQIGDEVSTPFQDFETEYAFLQAQEPQSPDGTFRIETARNGADLQRLMAQPQTSVQVITVEGGQVLYGPLNAHKRAVRAAETTDAQLAEMLDNVKKLRELPHKVLFITLAHFTDNRIAGFSKTLDRPGVLRWLLKGLSKSKWLRASFFTKFGEGIHGDLDLGKFKPVDCPEYSIKSVAMPYTETTAQGKGFEIIKALLAPDSGASKRILVDVKHFDIQARFEYYKLIQQLQTEYHQRIPIVAGHVAMSGETLPVAMATALNPLFDKYQEVEDPGAFYQEQIDKYNGDWLCRTSRLKEEDKKKFFLNPEEVKNEFNPFTLQLIDNETTGWFYPWGINLANEEVKIIYDSEGIIGLNLDERILGGYMLKYTDSDRERLHRKYKALRESGYTFRNPAAASVIDFNEYYRCEPFLRNMLHVVFHSGRLDRTAWDRLAIGSDFDGLIDPLDLCPTAADMPEFHRKAVAYLEVYWQLHKDDHTYHQRDLFFNGTITYAEAIHKVFYQNARDFVVQNF